MEKMEKLGRREKRLSIIYAAMIIALAFTLALSVYWQLERDVASFELTEMSVTTTERNRAFFVPIEFCSGALTEFTVIRYYHDLERDIYYSVPDGNYRTSINDCFSTRLSANTGRLEPGQYEYRISVYYRINPIRTVQREIAIVQVTVK